MPIIKTERLIVVKAEQIEFKDKQTGELVKKWKYIFLTPDGKLIKGFDNVGLYKNDVQVVRNGFEDSKAKDVYWELTEFNGETNQKLYTGDIKKAK